MNSDMALMMACPVAEVSYEWNDTITTCIRKRTVNTDGMLGTPMTDAVLPIKCRLEGTNLNDD